MADRDRMKRRLIAAAVVLGILVVVWGIARILSEPASEKPFFDAFPVDRPSVIAHRGGADLWPENTLSAFRAARNLGVDGIELDVHASADGIPVVVHDSTVDRTTDGSGAVSEMTVEQLRQLDAGYTFTAPNDDASTPYRGMGLTIPTLREVFEELPDTPIIVEIKPESDELVAAVGNLIAEFGREELTLVASFSGEVQERFRQEYPDVATAGVQSEIVPFLILNWMLIPGVYSPPAESFFVPTHTGPLPVTTRRFISNAQRRGIFVGAWTINDEPTMTQLIEREIDAILTDRPDLALELVGEL